DIPADFKHAVVQFQLGDINGIVRDFGSVNAPFICPICLNSIFSYKKNFASLFSMKCKNSAPFLHSGLYFYVSI
ncbi:MAG: hypothetical protein BWK80_58705, partial [Desulfobacteraceae bacterium IS3]